MKFLAAFMQGRSPREARAIKTIAGVLLLVVVAAFAWLPLERSRARLAGELPALRASVETLQRQSDEVKRIRAMPPAPGQQAPVSALASTPPAGAQVAALDPKRIRLTSNDAAFTTLLEWVVAAEASHGLRVDSARVEALGAPGRVKAEILMSRS